MYLEHLVTEEVVEQVRRELSISGTGLAVVDIPEQLHNALKLDEDECTAMMQFINKHDETASIFQKNPPAGDTSDRCFVGDRSR